jgi:plastocyanin
MMRKLLFVWVAISFGAVIGCASLSTRNSEEITIRISNKALSGDLELTPSLLKVKPGQRVVWSNNTKYNIRVQFEPETAESMSERPFFISPLGVARGKFEAEGDYSYTVIFSSDKIFGQATGTVVVEDPGHQDAPHEIAPEHFPSEETPADPYII